MGYLKSNDEWASTEDVTLADESNVTANGNSDAVELGDKGTARLTLDVTAFDDADGDETLDVKVQTRKDSNGSWRDVASFDQITATGSERKSFTGLDREVRADWTVGGTTPDADFTVSGEAV